MKRLNIVIDRCVTIYHDYGNKSSIVKIPSSDLSCHSFVYYIRQSYDKEKANSLRWCFHVERSVPSNLYFIRLTFHKRKEYQFIPLAVYL